MIIRIFHALAPLTFNDTQRWTGYTLWDASMSCDRKLFCNKEPATGAHIYCKKMKHCTQWDWVQGEWNFCKAFDVKTQLVFNRSVIVSMQLDAVSPLSEYPVKMRNLLVVKWKSTVNVLVQISEEKSIQYLLEESYYSLPAAFSVLSWCWSGFGPAQCSINSHSVLQGYK